MTKELRAMLQNVRLVFTDFDGVWTSKAQVHVHQDGTELVTCCRRDTLLLGRMEKKLGVQFIIVSKEANPVVKARADKMGIECLQGVEDKREAVTEYLREKGLKKAQAAFIGDDINDIPAFSAVGLGVSVGDAHPLVLKAAKVNLETNGGEGAIRELQELIVSACGQDLAAFYAS